ncbi:MAG: nuclear transport factor 2 family protein [Acidobacteriota bacterium]|nr:nuclear transport factor 2 family protein [Acidobacteriota bacterium]
MTIMKHTLVASAFILSMLLASASAQDTNSGAQPAGQQSDSPAPPPKTQAPANEATPQRPTQSTTPAANAARERRAAPARAPQQDATDPAVKAVNAVFNTLIDAIRRADAEAAMSVYWKSPHLLVFNYNGTATTTWDQVRANRASSYPKMGNVKLDVRDVRVQILGRDAALVTCLWSQSQTFDGKPESSTGRLSLVFRHVGTEWKIFHTHTSPDNPDPSRVMPSERTATTTTTTSTSPTPATTTPPPAKP